MTRDTEPNPLVFSPDERRALLAERRRGEHAGQRQRAPANAPTVADHAPARPQRGARATEGARQTATETSEADRPKPFAAVAAAAGLEVEVRAWLKLQRKAKDFGPEYALAMAQHRRAGFAAEVERQLGPVATALTLGRIVADSKRQLRQDLKAAGIKPVVIPGQDKHMQQAIAELVRHVDAGKKPSARAAALSRGLDEAQVKKLAERVAVKSEAVNAGICLAASSPFVVRLRQSPPSLALVVAPHARLTALARVMGNVQKLLATKPGAPIAGRGAWHAQAEVLWTAGHTANAIARLTGQSLGAVKAHLRRRGMRRAAASAGTAT